MISWPAAKGMRWVNPSMTIRSSSCTKRATVSFIVMSFDIARHSAPVEKARRAVESPWDLLDLRANHAALFGTQGGAPEGRDLGEVRRDFEVNTLDPLRVSRAFLPVHHKGSRPRRLHTNSLKGT